MQARKTLLFKSTKLWVQKSETRNFNVPCGAMMVQKYDS